MKKSTNTELKWHYIEHFSLADYLSDETIKNIDLISVNKGEYLYHQNDELSYIYFLVNGKLHVNYVQDSGIESVYSFETPFSVIGEVELFSNDKIRRNVQACEDSTVLALSAKYVLEHAYDNVQFLHFIISRLRKRIVFVSSLLSQSSESVEFLISRYLLQRAEKEGYELKLEKRESLSAMLGISTRHLNRILKNLHEKNIIFLKNKTLIIRNESYLLDLIKKGH
ncbi:Crp/Fnr family transcriptional regulator [Vibrio sp. SA48]|uniref:Crp/Fnr family transcriptional regulator n=1 Tax=Vibrio sp. S12_S33 TaxID=2720223 RepID=UPI00178237F7|nr:Crp/Fnr family transcriptional regulator [Vibrio sp. S12_S33]MBD1565134.1 Crp/Fnr family transcriptional regulator [Vibrio sp. S12_S33]